MVKRISNDDLNEIAARARSAAKRGNEGYFVDTLIQVSEHDVPRLIEALARRKGPSVELLELSAEVDRLRGIIESAMADKSGSMERVYKILEKALEA